MLNIIQTALHQIRLFTVKEIEANLIIMVHLLSKLKGEGLDGFWSLSSFFTAVSCSGSLFLSELNSTSTSRADLMSPPLMVRTLLCSSLFLSWSILIASFSSSSQASLVLLLNSWNDSNFDFNLLQQTGK